MERVLLEVLFNYKLHIKNHLMFYYQNTFLTRYHLTLAPLTVFFYSKNWQLPDLQKGLLTSESFSFRIVL